MKKIVLVILLIIAFHTTVFAQDTIYVSAKGAKDSLGWSAAEPTRTLSRALLQAFLLDTVTKIIIIGTLDDRSEEGNSSNYVFTIADQASNLLEKNFSNKEIIITGKQNASSVEKAVLSAKGSNKRVLNIVGVKIRFENIEISGGSGGNIGEGLCLRDGAQVTLGQGALIQENFGVGIILSNLGGSVTCIIDGGEVRNNRDSGVFIISGNVTLRSGTISGNTTSQIGGGVCIAGGTFTQDGGTISGNTALKGGGGVCVGNGTFTQNGGTINGNAASKAGGGVFVVSGTTFTQNGTVSNNTAPTGANVARN